MKYAQFRIALLTLALGIASTLFFNALRYRWSEPLVNLPKVESEAPIFIGIENDKKYLSKGGGASGGRTCDEFIKSLGKLTRKSLISIAESPCHDLRSIPELNNKFIQK